MARGEGKKNGFFSKLLFIITGGLCMYTGPNAVVLLDEVEKVINTFRK